MHAIFIAIALRKLVKVKKNQNQITIARVVCFLFIATYLDALANFALALNGNRCTRAHHFKKYLHSRSIFKFALTLCAQKWQYS